MKTASPVPPRRHLRANLIYYIGANCLFSVEALNPDFIKDVMILVHTVIFNIDNENRGNTAAILNVLSEIERRSRIRSYSDIDSRVRRIRQIRLEILTNMQDTSHVSTTLQPLPDNLCQDMSIVKSVFLLCDYFYRRISRPEFLDNPNVQYFTQLFTSQTMLPPELDRHKGNIVLHALEALLNPTIEIEKYRILQNLLKEDNAFEQKQERSIFSKISYNINHTLHLRNVLQNICGIITQNTIEKACDDKIADTIHKAFFLNQAEKKYQAKDVANLIMEYYREPSDHEIKSTAPLKK